MTIKTDDAVEQVKQFNIAAGNTVDRYNPRQAALYFGLQCEEVAEKLKHLGFGTTAHSLQMIGNQFKGGHFDDSFEMARGNLRENLLDDDLDILVVTIGSMLSMGVDVKAAFNEVHRSNMSKLFPDGTMHKDVNGKVIKPETYSAPNLKPFLLNRG